MINPIKILLTTAGASTDTFSLFSDADGFVTPFATGITRAQLLAGYVSKVAPDLTTIVRVKSNSACVNSIDLDLIRKLTLSTTSTLAAWSPYQVTNTGAVLTWDISGDITPTSQTINDPTFDLSANTGTVNMVAYDAVNVTYLDCYSNFVSILDISKLINLTFLDCNSNQLTSLDLSQNTLLEVIICDTNQLSVLDSTNNINITDIICYSNLLTVLDISQNINLVNLSCNNNQIALLDISNNILLKNLRCESNLFDPTATDNIFINLDNNGQTNGQLAIKNNRTSASDTARANLISKGWAISDAYAT